MSKLGAVAEEATTEEIRASIRRMTSDGDAPSASPEAIEPTVDMDDLPEDVAPFVTADDNEPEVETSEEPADDMVERAIAQAIEDAEAEVRADATDVLTSPTIDDSGAPLDAVATEEPQVADPPVGSIAHHLSATPGPAARPSQAEERRGSRPPLLSPQTDAVVSGAFNQLATTMLLSGSRRTVDQLVEDMLRPLLRNWLDVNLPPLVEKLVREEIQRVSRGRR